MPPSTRALGWILRPAVAGALATACASTGVPGTDSPPGAGDAGAEASAAAGGTPPSVGGLDSGPPPPTAGDGSSAAGPDAGPGGSAGDSGTEAGPPSQTDAGPLIDQLLKLTASCSGSSIVSAHTYSANNGAPVDVCKLNGAIYYTAKMAIDCDGRTTPNCPGTGANKDCCYYNDTSFHNLQGQPLSAEYDRYVVIPQDFTYPGLDQNAGGNVVAVIYHGQLEYAVFGDQGPSDLIGEASYFTAANLGINPSPASGGVGGDVTYIVFVGTGARPSDIENQAEIQQLGGKLAQGLTANNP